MKPNENQSLERILESAIVVSRADLITVNCAPRANRRSMVFASGSRTSTLKVVSPSGSSMI